MEDFEKSCIGKLVFFPDNTYQIQQGNIGEGTVSLKNAMLGDFLRHRDGILEHNTWHDDELFLHDSSFYPVQENGMVRFYCSNQGLEAFRIANVGGRMCIVDEADCGQDGVQTEFALLDSDAIPIREHFIGTENKKLIAFGSSGTEIFDYVFGDNPDYMPFWASGWSARGLIDVVEHIAPYHEYLKQVSPESTVLLQFGSVDIDFNMAFKAETQGFYQIETFLREMVNGVLALREYLAAKYGLHKIYAVFTAPSVELPPEYWRDRFGLPHFPVRMRAKMMWDFAVMLSSQMSVINCLPELVESVENPVCSRRYVREYPDHHINFAVAQDIVYRKLKQHIPELPEQAQPPHHQLYEHLVYGVDDVNRLHKARPRTCRKAG